MATLPKEQDVLVDVWGPHLNRMEGLRVDTGAEPDKIVPTHCCFCGQQCGINLKVKDNLVIGFEPRYDFPFNKGMLCPKGVKRYLQGGHPDRLTTALQRDSEAAGGFSPLPYDAAVARVAAEINRIQSTYGPDAMGVLSGASLTTEKAYLMGKFARVCLKTKYIDYNGRLCMVSAGAAELWGTAKTSFLRHARGIEHHSHGVENCLSTINIVLASGRIGKPCCAYGTVVGQGNGQGGREHGQKAEQLPGWRDISNPAHREYVAGVWGVKADELPQAGVDCYEMMRKIDAGEAKQDWRVIQAIATALGRPHGFTFQSPREIFDELRVASKGGVADYYGITYEKIEAQNGVFWPCPTEEHPGTPRLFEAGSWNPIANGAGPFYFPDGKARFNVAASRPPAEDVDDAYPIFLTTGRVVSQFLSGTPTRRIGPLVDQYPEPRIEIHPRLAQKYGIGDGDWTTVESRRGTITLRAQVVTTIRPDTIFIPYHWPGRQAANQLTIAAQDPVSKIPEYKVCAVRIAKSENGQQPTANGQPGGRQG